MIKNRNDDVQRLVELALPEDHTRGMQEIKVYRMKWFFPMYALWTKVHCNKLFNLVRGPNFVPNGNGVDIEKLKHKQAKNGRLL